jgi:RNA polymerase sigma factor (sigma-70 family)
MEIIFYKVCLLVTAAFALTLVPGFRRSERSLLSVRDRGTALLVFLVLGLVEEAAVGQTGWFNHRIVAVCAAGLLAGSGVGVVVAAFVTWMAVAYDGRPLGPIGISMLCGGLVGGWLYRRRPRLAQQPLTGFCLTFTVAWVRDCLTLLCTPGQRAGVQTFGHIGMASVLQGLGTALILASVARARELDEQAQAAAAAEVGALQARMNPHFLFNALNALAALATVAPREIPRAAGRLRHFLRASFDQHDRALVPLEEELAVMRAYLDIESLRLGSRLQVEEAIGSGLAEVLAPPFSLQPLVENGVQHGLQSSPEAGRLRIVARLAGQWLEMSVSDDGQGVPSADVEHVFFGARPRVHALGLLRRRLQALFGRSFQLAVRSEVGQGTTVTIRIPLRTRVEVAGRSLENITRQQLRQLGQKEAVLSNRDFYSSQMRTAPCFEELFLPHLDAAYSLARWIVGRDQDAQDVVQEAYARALKGFSGFRGENPRAWLLTIVRNTAYKWIKKHLNEEKLIPFDEDAHAVPVEVGPSELSQERRQLLQEALNRLPVEFREVLVLFEIEGWSYRAMAGALNVPLGTVMSRLSRARRRLQQELTQMRDKGIEDEL